jgi:hypothetical protein
MPVCRWYEQPDAVLQGVEPLPHSAPRGAQEAAHAIDPHWLQPGHAHAHQHARGRQHRDGSGAPPDLAALGTVSAVHSLIGDPAGHTVTNGIDGNIVGVSAANLHLGAQAGNDGPTPTRALLPGSPAINAADSRSCPATDQRGVWRPHGEGYDIGAYEYDYPVFTGFFSPVNERPA